MPSRRIEDLHPKAQQLARMLLADCESKLGVTFLITSTLRLFEEQAALYAIGRTEQLGRAPVTKSKPGHSWHEYGLAFDGVPLIGGKAVYTDDKLFDEIGGLGQEIGLRWGGDAGFVAAHMVDKPHFQYNCGMTTDDALALYQNGGMAAVWAEIDRRDSEN